MYNLPGTNGYQCIYGANLTWDNIGFAIIMSLAVGLVVVALTEMIRRKKEILGAELGIVSLVGMVFGFLTTFCTFCSLPLISLFGATIALTWFTDYEWYFKILSLALLGISLYVLDNQLKGDCKVCKIKVRKK